MEASDLGSPSESTDSAGHVVSGRTAPLRGRDAGEQSLGASNDGNSTSPSVSGTSVPSAVEEMQALLHAPQDMEPQTLFEGFSRILLSVEKKDLGTPDDPTLSILELALQTPGSFWDAAVASSPATLDVAGRCRNWMVAEVRQKNLHATDSALLVLLKLPLSDELIKQIKLRQVIKKLESVDGRTGKLAAQLSDRYPTALDDEATYQPSRKAASAAPARLFGNVGVLKMGSHKRGRESPEPQLLSGVESVNLEHNDDTDDAEFRRVKRTKQAKTVHWKPDSELVMVRFFEMEGEARFKSAKNAKLQEHDEGSPLHPNIPWVEPHEVDFTGAFSSEQLRAAMSSKRGGLRTPDSTEARLQKEREDTSPSVAPGDVHSPAEPDAAEEPPSAGPRQGGRFVPAQAPSWWLQKQGQAHIASGAPSMAMNPLTMNPMNPVGAMPPMMMGAFPWGMGYPMPGMIPGQMNGMMAPMNNGSMPGMFSNPGVNNK